MKHFISTILPAMLLCMSEAPVPTAIKTEEHKDIN